MFRVAPTWLASLLLISSLPATSLSPPAPRNRSSQKPYTNGGRAYKLEGNLFNEKYLTSFFKSILRRTEAEEVYVIATADPRFFLMPTPAELRQMHPLRTNEPIANFFKIKDNTFYQFRNQQGEIRWVTLQGKNVLEPVIDGLRIYFANQVFSRNEDEPSNHPSLREATLVLPAVAGLSKKQILEIIKYYDKLFDRPKGLSIEISETCRSVEVYSSATLPALCRKGMRVATLPEVHRVVSYFRSGFGFQRVVVYDNRKLFFSLDLKPEDLQ